MKVKTKKIPNINARDFSTILKINPYQTPFQLLESKIENKNPFLGNKFTEHGNKYEKYAIKLYSKITGNKVDTNQKNMKHPNYKWITGRPDGIVKCSKKRKRNEYENNDTEKNNYENKTLILEIKCPLKDNRNVPLSIDNIPKHYWTQCQVYMNIIDCDICHYVEYYINPESTDYLSGSLHYITIKRDKEWWNNSISIIKKFYEEIKVYYNKGSLDTHPVRIVEKQWEKNFEI